MAKKYLYEKLKNEEDGIWVSDYSSVRWEDYIPSDSELVVDEWHPLSEDPGSSAGIEIFYSAKNDEFYLRSWRHQYANNTGSRVKILTKEEVVDLIINKQLVDELSPGWQRDLGIRKEEGK